MKKFKALLLSMLLVFSLALSGCTKDDDSSGESATKKETETMINDSKSEESKVNYPKTGEGPLVEEKITLTAIIPSTGWVPDIENNRLTKLLEERLNVHIEWTETTKEQFKDKLSIMIAAGECPDIILGTGVISKQDYEKYGKAGVFLDLTKYLDSNTYHFKKVLEKYPKGKPYMTADDGKKYALPSFGGAYHMTLQNKYWINKTWLDNLGLDVPTTTEEYREVLRAFKENDPNGNGIADEIPVTGSLRAVEDSAAFLISSFIPAGCEDRSGIATENNYVFIMDDKVTFTGNKPEFKEGISYVKSLYDEGLFDPAAFTQNRDQIKPLVDGDYNRIGGMASHHPGNFSSLSDMENGRFHDYVAMPPLKSPSGYSSTPWNYSSGLMATMAISADCKYPEIALMWGDYFYKEEMSVIATRGFEGEHWHKPAEGAIGLNGKPARFGETVGEKIHEMNVILGGAGPKDTTGFNESNERPEGYSYEAMLFDASQNIMEPHKVKRYPYELMSVKEEDLNKFTELRATIHGYVTESVDRFIVGDLSLEKDWDSYVKQLDDLGLEKYLELLNKYVAK